MDQYKRLCVKLLHSGNINPVNPLDQEQKNMFFMPMGLFPLAEVLKRNGVNIEILHLDLEAGKSLEEILDFSTLDAVGFDCHWVNQSLTVIDTAAI